MNEKQIAIPTHIAIIMDGNRRWAKSKGLPAVSGHKYVADKVLEPLIEHAAKLGVQFVTLWAFSTENWQRDVQEVRGIMTIFRHALKKMGMRMHKKGIKIRVIGDLSRFDADIQKAVHNLIELTKNNTRITVVFALNYGGRDEIIRAMRKLRASSPFTVDGSQLEQKDFVEFLDTHGIPDPDIIVRTGGEQRLSGFLPWQSVYSELYFPQWFMPDFSVDKLDEVIEEFTKRKRRFGK